MARSHDVKELGTESPLRLIGRLAVPTVCANMVTSLYSMVDRLFIGQFVGGTTLAAVGLIAPLNNVTAACTVMLSVGGGAMIATAFGAQDADRANTAFTNIVTLSLIMAAAVSGIFIALAPQLCVLCGGEEGSDLVALASTFLRITSIGTLFQVINVGFASMIRSEGNTTYAMFVTMIGAVINVGLNALTIIVLGMGLLGSAWSTVISSSISATLSASYFRRGHGAAKWAGWSAVHPATMGKVCAMGIAPAIFQVLSFANNIFINRSLVGCATAELGSDGRTIVLAANSVISTVESVATMFIMGVNNAVSTVLSFNNGAKKYDRVFSAAVIGQVLATTAALVLWLVWRLLPGPVFSAFVGDDQRIIDVGIRAVTIGKLFVFGLGFQTLASMYFSALGRPQTATLISVSRNGLFLIPALLVLPGMLGLDGVYASTSVSDACSLVLVAFIYLRDLKRLKGLAQAQAQGQETQAPSQTSAS